MQSTGPSQVLGDSPLPLSLSCRVWPGPLWQPALLSSFLTKDTAGNTSAQGCSSDCHVENLVQCSRCRRSESAPEGYVCKCSCGCHSTSGYSITYK